MKINIEYNPFTVDTKFLINGNMPDDITFSELSSRRLQEWIESFFISLEKKFNGMKEFDITFRGLESDYLDILAAVEIAKKGGFNINLDFDGVQNSDSRLSLIQNLVKEAQEHELFKDKLNNKSILDNLDKSFNKDFDVYVAATMSSGKSTLINAMLGADLLPAANEATTATIAKIYDTNSPVGKFKGKRIGFNGDLFEYEPNLNLEVLKEWNSKVDTAVIEIEGNISGMTKRDDVRLVISDTPGPNNSQTDDHLMTTMKHMKDTTRNPLILYVLNATQLGINDDKNTLTMMANIINSGGKQNKDRFIFAVNKMDVISTDKGESIESTLDRVKNYLISNGISNPVIYPISAYLAGLIRKRNSQQRLSRTEIADLSALELKFTSCEEEDYVGMDLSQYSKLTSTVEKKLNNSNYVDLEIKSGLPVIEKVIDDYIEKYNLPERVFRAFRALDDVIKECSNEAELVKSLELNQNEMKKVKEMIVHLRKTKDESSNLEVYISQLKEQGIGLPIALVEKANDLEKHVQTLFRGQSEQFNGVVAESVAIRAVDRLKSDVEFYYKDISSSYDMILEQLDPIMKENLEKEYKERVKSIFDDVSEFNMPQLEKIKLQVESSFINDLDRVNKNEVSEREETKKVYKGQKSREVSNSKWWNPFSWGSTRTVYEDIYEDVTNTIREVDLSVIWEKRSKIILVEFNQLSNQFANKIQERQNILLEKYINFMEKEFSPKFDAILNELEAKMENEKELSEKIAIAEKQLEQLSEFRTKLDQIISL